MANQAEGKQAGKIFRDILTTINNVANPTVTHDFDLVRFLQKNWMILLAAYLLSRRKLF